MAVTKITAASVSSLEPGQTIWDQDLKGFGARKQRRAVVYVFKYRAGGKQRLLTIGRHGSPWSPEEARDAATRYAAGSCGVKPEAAKTHSAFECGRDPFFADVARRYLNNFAKSHKRPRSLAEDERNLDLHILPQIGRLRMSQISRKEITAFHLSRADQPANANRCLALISHIFSKAEEWRLREKGTNPCRGIVRFTERPRERLISFEELQRLGNALTAAELRGKQQAGKPFVDWRTIAVIKLLIYTGARLTEVLSLKWENIDFENRIAFLPNGPRSKHLLLPPPALSVVKALLERDLRDQPGGYLFPGNGRHTFFTGIQKPWQRLRSTAGLDDLRLEDLRRLHEHTARQERDPFVDVAYRTAFRLEETLSRKRAP